MTNQNSDITASLTPEQIGEVKLTPEQSRTLYQQMYCSTEENNPEEAKKWSQDIFNYEPWPLWLAQLLCKKKKNEPWPAWIEVTFKSKEVVYLKLACIATLWLTIPVVFLIMQMGFKTNYVYSSIILCIWLIIASMIVSKCLQIFG